MQSFRFAISASFTAEPIQPVLAFWGRTLDTAFEARFAPYNQLQQTLLDPASEFAANHHGVNVLLFRIEDLGEQWEVNLAQLAGALREAAAHLSVPLVAVVCPPTGTMPRAVSRDAAARFAAMLEDTTGVQVLSAAEIERLYPVEQVHSPEGERLGHIPYTELYFCALGTALVRLAHALFAPPYKVIALDCDNTLWQGICGEDGPLGIVVDPPRRALQQFMAEQREQGMLLALASKNNESDVAETFEHNPAMPLQMRHFVAWRLNWDSKAASLAAIADELSLGLDSFIFVDDNPKECAEVEQGVPEVLALALPENPAEIPHFLEHVWAFDHPVVTEEDRNRNAYYAQSQEFGRELKRSASLTDFMNSLDLKVRIEPLAEDRLARAAQLTQRTNQFNFTSIRRSEAEILALVREGGYECVTVEATDRFGDYGLVGVMIFRAAENAIELDTFLLSCRALGRGVEHRMLAYLGTEAARRGLAEVALKYVQTRRNLPARQFLEEQGFDLEAQAPLQAAAAASAEWKPSGRVARPAPAAKRVPSARRFVEFAAIAQTLSRPEQILEAMRHGPQASLVAELTPTEQQLAAIWASLLQRPSVGVSDNFFDLGGHSLLAVMLVMRVRETFGVELPIDDVYSASLTLGELARRIEAYQAGETVPAEYEALLAEIENLSDEEVRRLLAEEDPGALRP